MLLTCSNKWDHLNHLSPYSMGFGEKLTHVLHIHSPCFIQNEDTLVIELLLIVIQKKTTAEETARMIDSGSKKVAKESAMCKVFASDVAMKVTVNAVQILGGYGYMKEYPVEKMMRDAKITQIYEGTNEIQRGVIAGNLIKEYAAKK